MGVGYVDKGMPAKATSRILSYEPLGPFQCPSYAHRRPLPRPIHRCYPTNIPRYTLGYSFQYKKACFLPCHSSPTVNGDHR